VFSPEILSANIEALVRAQGLCPTLGALPTTIVVAAIGARLCVELHTPDDRWHRLEMSLNEEIGRERARDYQRQPIDRDRTGDHHRPVAWRVSGPGPA
jgi:hypothetical protein